MLWDELIPVLGPTGDFVDIEQNKIEMLTRGSSVSSSGVGITGVTTTSIILFAAPLHPINAPTLLVLGPRYCINTDAASTTPNNMNNTCGK